MKILTSHNTYILSELLRKRVKKKGFQVKSIGKSMLPFFKPNTSLTLEVATHIRLGDVVCYLNNSLIVCHRVVQMKDGMIVTKGDNSLHLDKTIISREQILGKICPNKDKASVYKENINYIIALHSLLQAKSYSILTNNKVAKAYCKIMSKYLKVPFLSIIYKVTTRLIIYQLFLFNKIITIKWHKYPKGSS